ncbi:MAG: hypothetical protein LBD11_03620, partial [Candidatus Peribacteria bacterium]|nr:hypothetical protein [Candidatus Peribacteria bacterium]
LPETFIEPSITDLKIDIAGLSQQMTDQINQLYMLMAQQIQQACQETASTAPTTSVDLNAQKKAELQVQIDQLQSEMNSL